MQMMSDIADRRIEAKSRDTSDTAPTRHADRTEDPQADELRTDKPRDKDDADQAKAGDKEKNHDAVAESVALNPATIDPAVIASASETTTTSNGDVGSLTGTRNAPQVSAPRSTAASATQGDAVDGARAANPQGQSLPPQSVPNQPTQSQSATPQSPVADQASAVARIVPPPVKQGESSEAAIKLSGAGNGAGQKTDGAAGRPDALMGAKVSVEGPAPVARSQGVSSAVLVQAQQAAATAQPQLQTSTANGGAGTLHVGGNQPTFVGADGNASGGQGAAGQNSGGQNNAGQNGGAQNQGQNTGQNGQTNPQQIGASFGATIGQRGFGGDASRAEFQQILATRTARPQPAALASGESGRPMGASGGSLSTTPLTMAGVGGPQSTHTSASLVNRAAATAHGRPGATLGTPADQVAVKLSATAKDGGGKVTVRLNPEELGKVDIKMEISRDGHVRAIVAAERPETLELLQRDAKALERALQDAGLQTDGDSLEFDLRGDGGRFAENSGDEPANKPGAAPEIDDGDVVADDQQSDTGSGGLKADGSLDMVA